MKITPEWSSIQEVHRTRFIITTNPTQEDLDRAEREEKLVLVFVHAPLSQIQTVFAGHSVGDELLKKWGLEPNHRLAVYACPEASDLEECREIVLDALVQKESWYAPAHGGPWKTTVKGFRIPANKQKT